MPKSRNVHEVAFYYGDGHVLAGALISKMCGRHPVHAIFGERSEMISLKTRAELCDASQGRIMASISVVPKCGHLAVQENPDGVASAIFSALRGSGGSAKVPAARLQICNIVRQHLAHSALWSCRVT
ncbi:hypothetical protein C8T65DRAFT_137555 [Cerioporus squamosus]|nr:hypothetical protein C8T65DRAFT_137555 [Cerioporus squamosus]